MRGDVKHFAVDDLVHTLICSRAAQRAEVLQIRAELDIVEIVEIECRCQQRTATVPGGVQLFVALTQVLHQPVDFGGAGIATHKGDAGYVVVALGDKIVDSLVGERFADVVPKVGRMASGTPARASADVDGKGHLVWNLLKDNIAVGVLEQRKKVKG